MKRFYCTVCKKVKRVQKFPILVENVEATDPTLRVGSCNRHALPKKVKQFTISEVKWTPANTAQADGRMNRTNSKVRKVR